jgi:bifunctional pyridoxal-dependent enzyme with beta-cystathionase and maltose regulon repressor activities
MLPEMRTACIEDRWPDALVSCVLASKPRDLAALEQCNTLMPKDLQDKLQQRMLRAQGVTPNATP